MERAILTKSPSFNFLYYLIVFLANILPYIYLAYSKAYIFTDYHPWIFGFIIGWVLLSGKIVFPSNEKNLLRVDNKTIAFFCLSIPYCLWFLLVITCAQIILSVLPVIFACIFFFSIWFTCRKTSFFIFDKSLQYRRELITFAQKNLRYQDVKEVTLHRGILQRLFGLGTVQVTTHATTQDAGIKMYNLKDYQEVYDLLMKKVHG